MSIFTRILERPELRYGIVIYMAVIMFGVIGYYIQINKELSPSILNARTEFRVNEQLASALQLMRREINVIKNSIGSES